MHKTYSQLKDICYYNFYSFGNGSENGFEDSVPDHFSYISENCSYGEGYFSFGNGDGESTLIDSCYDTPSKFVRSIFTFHSPDDIDA